MPWLFIECLDGNIGSCSESVIAVIAVHAFPNKGTDKEKVLTWMENQLELLQISQQCVDNFASNFNNECLCTSSGT